MTNIGPLIRSPEWLQSSPTIGNCRAGVEENGAQLLELRTETGAVYICPSRWQRVRLRWAFRHFRVLPLQLLSRRDQRLIQRLMLSRLATPDLPVAKDAVFGVVEKVLSKAPASAGRLVAVRTELAGMQISPAKPEIALLPSVDLSNPERGFVEKFNIGYLSAAKSSGSISGQDRIAAGRRAAKETAGYRGAWCVHRTFLQRWGALGLIAATGCLTVILARVGVFSLFPGNPQAPSAPVARVANRLKPPDLHTLESGPIQVLLPTLPLPGSGERKDKVALLLPESMLAPRKSLTPSGEPEQSGKTIVSAPAIIESAIAPPGTSGRVLVTELPQDHFVHPIVSNPNLVGDLQLKALIGADGSVQKVTVVSGNQRLAEAGIRAVQQWRYSPNQILGRSGEMETQIKMSFFGQDAVSIMSVANDHTSEPK